VNEANDDVRTQIRQYAGKIGNPMLVGPYEQAWETSKSKAERDATLRGIGAMWWGWPLFSYSVESAYRLHMKIMEAYKTKPYDGGFMAIGALGNFPVSSSNRSFTQWKSQASYYKPEEVQAVAKAVLMNNKSDWLSRNTAIQVMWTHGVSDKAVLEKLVDEIQASGDTDFNVKSFRRTITNLRPAN
ncbi:MAG: hypothetical protein HUK26_05575, partial [Duodenibacillus sp.]|nr:hypothetical protein [Duodenibacillus sp.]